MKNTIEHILQQSFSPTVLEVRDHSARHAGHAEAVRSGGGHFQVLIVSKRFAGLSRLARHRQVYAALQPHFRSGIHALTITALTPGEWDAQAKG